ncbi:STAS domain-containing protein [Kushneria phosphatilytica]|uniref:STAS domain-containing protein n=1 Tax=Kushneria phosphatilytica TaxID=657387 RepID=A0A1S1NPR4_9GAMM|nr:STAS domain-containing protein [Kushneria phosphatilytica]OHV10248.1 anti-anti-sigma factor [Kushneria phosphatilytica]QEL11546.1 STAS domain-containing protein [Kushneria phosphatilytica]
MNEGRIQAAFEEGTFVLKLSGDVRLTLCATLDQQVEPLAELPGLERVIVDLRDVVNMDSTALGFLAKIALAVRERLPNQPLVMVEHPDVLQMLEVMGFQQYVTIVEATGSEPDRFDELPAMESGEEELRSRILEAHRTLMQMSEHNRMEFQPLVELLESQHQSH